MYKVQSHKTSNLLHASAQCQHRRLQVLPKSAFIDSWIIHTCWRRIPHQRANKQSITQTKPYSIMGESKVKLGNNI